MKVLVTGGAGYIGSHTTLALNTAGYDVVVYDNLSSGRADAVIAPADLVVGELSDTARLNALMQEQRFDAVIHFAASLIVPESVTHPLKYYLNNTVNTTRLLDLAVANNIRHFVFSSSAAVYGTPEVMPITENVATAPINPYGRSKLMSEWIIRDTSTAYPAMSHCILRYFNVAGADPRGRIGQSTPEATHLVKVASQAALGKRDALYIFGTDYPTPDGTCVRDYIHVSDLADVHLEALRFLEAGHASTVFNCGYGHGYSVREIVDAVKRVSGTDFKVIETQRRQGDPPALVADNTAFIDSTGWSPRLDDIDTIVRTALEWEESC